MELSNLEVHWSTFIAELDGPLTVFYASQCLLQHKTPLSQKYPGAGFRICPGIDQFSGVLEPLSPTTAAVVDTILSTALAVVQHSWNARSTVPRLGGVCVESPIVKQQMMFRWPELEGMVIQGLDFTFGLRYVFIGFSANTEKLHVHLQLQSDQSRYSI